MEERSTEDSRTSFLSCCPRGPLWKCRLYLRKAPTGWNRSTHSLSIATTRRVNRSRQNTRRHQSNFFWGTHRINPKRWHSRKVQDRRSGRIRSCLAIHQLRLSSCQGPNWKTTGWSRKHTNQQHKFQIWNISNLLRREIIVSAYKVIGLLIFVQGRQ